VIIMSYAFFSSAAEASSYAYISIPKDLLFDPKYQKLSVSAKVIYALFLNRVWVSVHNPTGDFYDEEYKTYFIFYGSDELASVIGCSENSARNYCHELEEFGLITIKKMGQGKPSRIYPKNFASYLPDTENKEDEPVNAVENAAMPDMETVYTKKETQEDYSGKNIANNSKPIVIRETSVYTDVRRPADLSGLERKKRNSRPADLSGLEHKKRDSRITKNVSLESQNLGQSNNNIIYYNNIYNPSINKSCTGFHATGDVTDGSMEKGERENSFKDSFADSEGKSLSESEMRKTALREAEEELRNNLEIEHFEKYQNTESDYKEYLELYRLMQEIMESDSENIKIAGAVRPKGMVVKRFLELRPDHLMYVIDAMRKNTSDIRNIHAYLLTALYRSLETKDSFYSAWVSHERASETEKRGGEDRYSYSPRSPGDSDCQYIDTDLDRIRNEFRREKKQEENY